MSMTFLVDTYMIKSARDVLLQVMARLLRNQTIARIGDPSWTAAITLGALSNL